MAPVEQVLVFERKIFEKVGAFHGLEFNVENYLLTVSPQLKRLNTQLLFTYKLNPRTVLYLGYSDQYRGNEAYRLTQKNRTLFAKISYALSL